MSDNPLQAQQDTIRVPAYGNEGFRLDYPAFDQQLINCYAEVVRNPTTGDGEVVVTKRKGIVKVGSLDFSTHCAVLGIAALPLALISIPNLYDVYVAAYYDSTFIRIICFRPQAGTSVLMGSIAVGNASDKVYLSAGWTGSVAAPVHTVMVTWESGIGTTSKGYYADASTGTFAAASLTQITAAQSPWVLGKITRGPILQLNNQFYVATLDGVIYGTGTVTGIGSLQSAYVDRTDLTAGAEKGWVTPLAAVSSLVPDQFHCLVRYKHHLVACGKNSMQFFSDVGNGVGTEGIAIAATDQAFIKFGVLDGYHIINIDDILYWVAVGADNTLGVWRLDGYSPVKISSKKQDEEIRVTRKAAAYQYKIFSWVQAGKRHLGITGMYVYGLAYSSENYFTQDTGTTAGNIAANECYATIGMYNIEDKTWWYMGFADGQTGLPTSIHTCAAVGNQYPPTENPQNYVQRCLINDPVSTGTTYLFAPSETVYTDSNRSTVNANIAYTMTCNINTISFGTDKRKRVTRATLILGNNYAYGASFADTGSLHLAFTPINVRDNYLGSGTYPTDRLQTRSMVVPNSYYRYYWNNLGMFRTLSMSVVEKSQRPFVIKAIELNVAQGTN